MCIRDSFEDDDLLATNRDGTFVRTDLCAEATEDRVVLEEGRERLVIGQVVDGDNFDVGARRLNGAEEIAANAAEAVNAYTNGHRKLLLGWKVVLSLIH